MQVGREEGRKEGRIGEEGRESKLDGCIEETFPPSIILPVSGVGEKAYLKLISLIHVDFILFMGK